MIPYSPVGEVSYDEVHAESAGGRDIPLALVLWATAPGHHSAREFDLRTWSRCRGHRKSFHVTNPHTSAVITVTDAKGS
jgi:hypothetical protein